MLYKQAKNKWNKKTYSILEMTDSSVKLLREDGSNFKISLAEFNFSYYQLKDNKNES